ncbi:hypothetical protein CDD83_3043 [Cordyceps sp. RAO-2017]|nr:hypothetical protein CDD83_3043 [Cordyceps sp. RAO-2017]
MQTGGEKAELVQFEDWCQPDWWSGTSTPIFLIHDGGGTTFAYHCLDPLHRFVYGIPNPYFFSGSSFAGGLPEMGRLYAKRIRNVVSEVDFPGRRNTDGSTDVLLGGWSLGGFLSLEVAKVLADDYAVRVVGILMVDSVYPIRPQNFGGVIAPLDTSEENKSKNQVLSQRCMTEARRMLGGWEVPAWQSRLARKRPKMVLLRATECVPTKGPGISGLDIYRDDTTLGWEQHDEAMFEAVIDVEGHHFDLFSHERISATTVAIQQGLEALEKVIYPRGVRNGTGGRLNSLSFIR